MNLTITSKKETYFGSDTDQEAQIKKKERRFKRERERIVFCNVSTS